MSRSAAQQGARALLHGLLARGGRPAASGAAYEASGAHGSSLLAQPSAVPAAVRQYLSTFKGGAGSATGFGRLAAAEAATEAAAGLPGTFMVCRLTRFMQQRAWHRIMGTPGTRGTHSGGGGSSQLCSKEAAAASSQAAFARAGSATVGSEALTAGLSDGARSQMAWWLGGTAVWVYSMVVLGGVTRLTRSGLSMTEWKFTGERPPMNAADWQDEYDKYRNSPEFKKLHSTMTLPEFKFIFWMEYAHRMWGRFLGLAFVVPGVYFLARGCINGPLGKRLGLLFAMGGTQGLVGWWMVRSGLQEPKHEWETPRVSPYRLTAHLVSAFTIYSLLVWTALDVVQPRPLLLRDASDRAAAAGRRVRSRLLPFAALVAVTATSGAFVAGMDAGRAYNTYPLMGGRWVPEEYWEEGLTTLRNLFENTAAVQFDHRILAASTAASALALWTWVQSPAGPGPLLPPRARACMHAVLGITAVQFGLGIWTLLAYVPVHLGSAHQANALNLFTAVLFALHALRPPTPGPVSRALARYGAAAAATAVAAVGLGVTTQY